MIEETYVSFETAKLLKEKGFDACCKQFYEKDGWLRHASNCSNFNHSNYQEQEENILLTSAPTQSLAMRWLREVHNLFIWVTYHTGSGLNWSYEIHNIKDGKTLRSQLVVAGSYETCVENAIKYCLENLI